MQFLLLPVLALRRASLIGINPLDIALFHLLSVNI